MKMIENIELAELNEMPESGQTIFNEKDLAICGHIKTSAEIVLAKVDITLQQLFALKKGSVVETEQSIDSMATLVLNGKPIAHGRLVVAGDSFGFEVVEMK